MRISKITVFANKSVSIKYDKYSLGHTFQAELRGEEQLLSNARKCAESLRAVVFQMINDGLNGKGNSKIVMVTSYHDKSGKMILTEQEYNEDRKVRYEHVA